MSKRTMWLMVPVLLVIVAIEAIPGVSADEADKAKKLTTDDVVKLWSPNLKNATEYRHTGGSPKQSPEVAAYSFTVIGPSYGELWDHYAQLCGMKQRYDEKRFLITADVGPKGGYSMSDRGSGDGKGGRSLSVFLLKTEGYTVSATFHPDPDGKSISGSMTVAVR